MVNSSYSRIYIPKNKLSGIYELPQEVPACIKQKSMNLQSIGIRKRTIGNVDYEEEIIRVSNFKTTKGVN